MNTEYDIDIDENEIMNTESTPKRKTIPGKRAETSKKNAEIARQMRLEHLKKKKMLENYISKKAEEVMLSKRNGNLAVKEKPVKQRVIREESETDSDSSEEVIYVAPAPKRAIKKNDNDDEILKLKKELEELKSSKKEIKFSQSNDSEIINAMQKKILNF